MDEDVPGTDDVPEYIVKYAERIGPLELAPDRDLA